MKKYVENNLINNYIQSFQLSIEYSIFFVFKKDIVIQKIKKKILIVYKFPIYQQIYYQKSTSTIFYRQNEKSIVSNSMIYQVGFEKNLQFNPYQKRKKMENDFSYKIRILRI